MADDKKAKKTAEKTDSKKNESKKANAKKADSKKSDSKKGGKKSDKKADKKSKDKKGKTNPFKAIGSFFKSVRSEGKKVTWPKGKEVWKNTLVVVVVILIAGLIIFGVDRLLSEGMKGIKKLAEDKTTTSASSEGESTADALQALTENTTAAQEETTAATTEKAAD